MRETLLAFSALFLISHTVLIADPVERSVSVDPMFFASEKEVSAADGLALVIVAGESVVARARIGAPRIVTLSFQQKGPIELTCQGEPNWWCPRILLEATETGEAVFLPIFRSVELTGRFDGSDVERPEEVTVQGWARLAGREQPVASLATSVRVGEDGNFAFSAPEARLDLRLAAAGSAPWYRWNLDVARPGADLGTVRLRPGGSISGFLEAAESGEPIGGAELWAEPAAAIEQATVQERIERMAARGRTTEQGFFQLVGLEPGGYRLMARSQDRERQQVGEVEIRAGSETHLEHAITLHLALRYFVEVVPPVAPDGGAWSIELRSESDALAFGVPRVVAASEDGLALFERLIPGTYTLSVSDSSGARLAEQTDRIEALTRTVIEVPLIEVRGHLKLDGEPLVGEVSVATGSSDEVTLITDGEDAELAGWIREPKLAWLLITVRAQDPLIERRLRVPMPPIRARRMKLDIDLTGTDLEGVVVDGFDQPVAGASVRANAPGLGWAKGRSDDSGHFALRALSPGPYELSARHRKPSLGESEHRTVELFEGRAPPFQRLVLTRRVELRGRVVNADAASVAGASVDVMTVGPIPSHDREVTGLDGAFRMHVAAGAVAARFTIRAPSRLLWSTCLPLEEPLRDVMLQLPSVGVGTLEVIWPVPVAPSTWSPILVSDDGGVFDVQVLHDWNRALGGRGLVGDDVAHTVSVTVPRMAAGRRYALLELAQGTMPIGPGCRLNPPRAPDWVFLPVGSSVVVAAQENKEGQN